MRYLSAKHVKYLILILVIENRKRQSTSLEINDLRSIEYQLGACLATIYHGITSDRILY